MYYMHNISVQKILNKISLNVLLRSLSIIYQLHCTEHCVYNRGRTENMINILFSDDWKFYVRKIKPKLWNSLTGWFHQPCV